MNWSWFDIGLASPSVDLVSLAVVASPSASADSVPPPPALRLLAGRWHNGHRGQGVQHRPSATEHWSMHRRQQQGGNPHLAAHGTSQEHEVQPQEPGSSDSSRPSFRGVDMRCPSTYGRSAC